MTQAQTLTATLNPAAIAADIVAKRATTESNVTTLAKPAARKTSDNSKQGKATKDAGSAAFANISKQVKSTLVTCGGTDAEPTKVDAAKFSPVTLRELTNSGSTLQALAYNFLAGTVDKSFTVEALKELPRALRNEKGAITVLLGKKSADIRAAWEKAMAERKRKDAPTLRVLASLVKDTKPKGTTKSWKEQVADILDGKQSDKMKLQMLRELIAPKD